MKAFFFTSIPKSGTHLLRELFFYLGYSDGHDSNIIKENSFYRIHNWQHCTWTKAVCNESELGREFVMHSAKYTNHPIIFLYRNPIDILISERNYYPHLNTLHSYIFYNKNGLIKKGSEVYEILNDEKLKVQGDCFVNRINNYYGWLKAPNVIPIKFEDLFIKKKFERFLKGIVSILGIKKNIDTITDDFYCNIIGKENPTKTKKNKSKNHHLRNLLIKKYPKILELQKDFGYLQDDDLNKQIEGTKYDNLFFGNTPSSPILLLDLGEYNLIYYQYYFYVTSKIDGAFLPENYNNKYNNFYEALISIKNISNG